MCMVGRERGKDKSEQSEDQALSHVTAQSHKGYKMEVRVGVEGHWVRALHPQQAGDRPLGSLSALVL